MLSPMNAPSLWSILRPKGPRNAPFHPPAAALESIRIPAVKMNPVSQSRTLQVFDRQRSILAALPLKVSELRQGAGGVEATSSVRFESPVRTERVFNKRGCL